MTDPLTNLQSTLGPRYEVVRQAASGGMALVYLARDLKHQREVAVKVLRPDLAASLGAERFLREIELAARLQHPHIVPVYDSGATGGLLYYVMPFVEGESLRDRLAREGGLPVDEAVRLTREAASALAYAHAHGVVHRDIKPENIMLSGGHAVVTDFGIARALESSGTAQLTGLGFALGTPAYMSPEQATASGDVDARTDVYSLACVLYEMLAGEPPFTGPTAQAVMSKSITAPRPRVRALRPEIPPALEEVIVRALGREPAERFPTMSEFAEALGRSVTGAYPAAAPRRRRALVIGAVAAALIVAAGAAWLGTRAGRVGGAVAGAERIAVMPFSTSGPGVEYMREGMVDLLSTNLDAVGGIRVVDPRAVLRRWRERGGDGGVDVASALEIGRDLGARAVLVGSVVALGPKVRLTAELHSRGGDALAHAQVDGPADSLLGLVDGLSVELIRDVWRARTPVPQPRIGAVTTHSVPAMRAYLAGEQFYRRGQWDSAIVAFRRATAADSTFALAHFRLAIASGWGPPRNREYGDRAMEAAQRLRDRLPERDRALVMGFALYRDEDLSAVPAMRRYVASYPDDLDGWNTLGEAQFHARAALAMTPEALRAPFDTVLRMDSTLVPAMMHPIALGLMYRDSAVYARYGRMLAAAAGDSTYDRWLRDLARAVWGNAEESLEALSTLGGVSSDVGLAIISGRYRPPAAGFASVARAARAGQAVRGSRHDDLRLVTLRSLIADGQLRAASALADSMRADLRQSGRDSARTPGQLGDPARTIGHVVDFTPVVAGMARPERAAAYMTRYQCGSPADIYAEFHCAQYALATGRPAEVRRHVASARRRRELSNDREMRGYLTATEGAADLLAGDTTRGLARFRTGLDTAAYSEFDPRGGPLRFRFALALAARPDTREEAIRRLRYGFDTDVEFIPLTYLALGRAYEAAGQRDEAVAAYEHFLRLWEGADPELAHLAESARSALRALRRPG